MPRIKPSLIRQARLLDPHLPPLVSVCRDLPSAQNELRWLAEHAKVTKGPDRVLRRHVSRRTRGEPLQYILGSEYFGDLEIKCRRGVLIPRQETAASVIYLVRRIHDMRIRHAPSGRLRVLDLCTGTGCIPLLFNHEFYAKPEAEHGGLDLIAVDVSLTAIRLARENRDTHLHALRGTASSHEQNSLAELKVLRADVLACENVEGSQHIPSVTAAIQKGFRSNDAPKIDVLISNPPYISPKAYWTTTAPSVRHFEPKLALVPPRSSKAVAMSEASDGDTFYPHLLSLAEKLCAQVLMFEVADQQQAERVTGLAVDMDVWDVIEIWRDDPIARSEHREHQHTVVVRGQEVQVLGDGHCRSVFAHRRQPARG